MPLDDNLPPPRLPEGPSPRQIVGHILREFGVRVDTEGLDDLPERMRRHVTGARLPEPPEAVVLDRVLQLVPRMLLRSVERIVMVQTRGTARLGGALGGVLAISAEEARVRVRD